MCSIFHMGSLLEKSGWFLFYYYWFACLDHKVYPTELCHPQGAMIIAQKNWIDPSSGGKQPIQRSKLTLS